MALLPLLRQSQNKEEIFTELLGSMFAAEAAVMWPGRVCCGYLSCLGPRLRPIFRQSLAIYRYLPSRILNSVPTATLVLAPAGLRRPSPFYSPRPSKHVASFDNSAHAPLSLARAREGGRGKDSHTGLRALCEEFPRLLRSRTAEPSTSR